MSVDKPLALVTGASSGIGLELAEQLAERGFDLVINAEDDARLHRDMVARDAGRILVTSSIATTMPGSFQAVYNASKSFPQSFAEALRNELKDTGITATSLMPGPAETDFFHRADMDDTKVGKQKKDDPAQARQGLDALFRGKEKLVAGSLKTRAQTGYPYPAGAEASPWPPTGGRLGRYLWPLRRPGVCRRGGDNAEGFSGGRQCGPCAADTRGQSTFRRPMWSP